MNCHILNQSQLKKTGKKTVQLEQNREVFGYCTCFVQLEGIIAVVTLEIGAHPSCHFLALSSLSGFCYSVSDKLHYLLVEY